MNLDHLHHLKENQNKFRSEIVGSSCRAETVEGLALVATVGLEYQLPAAAAWAWLHWRRKEVAICCTSSLKNDSPSASWFPWAPGQKESQSSRGCWARGGGVRQTVSRMMINPAWEDTRRGHSHGLILRTRTALQAARNGDPTSTGPPGMWRDLSYSLGLQKARGQSLMYSLALLLNHVAHALRFIF